MTVADKVLASAALIFFVVCASLLVVLVCERTWIRFQSQTRAVKAAAQRRRAKYLPAYTPDNPPSDVAVETVPIPGRSPVTVVGHYQAP